MEIRQQAIELSNFLQADEFYFLYDNVEIKDYEKVKFEPNKFNMPTHLCFENEEEVFYIHNITNLHYKLKTSISLTGDDLITLAEKLKYRLLEKFYLRQNLERELNKKITERNVSKV